MQALALSQCYPSGINQLMEQASKKKTWLLVISSVKYREELITKRGLCVGVPVSHRKQGPSTMTEGTSTKGFVPQSF